jgi:hypothetical protein
LNVIWKVTGVANPSVIPFATPVLPEMVTVTDVAVAGIWK